MARLGRPGPSPDLVEAWRQRRAAGCSYELIAHLYGTTEARVRRALGGGGDPGAPRREDVDLDRLIDTWNATGSQRQTAALLGCSRTVVVLRLAEQGLIDWPDWLPARAGQTSATIASKDSSSHR